MGVAGPGEGGEQLGQVVLRLNEKARSRRVRDRFFESCCVPAHDGVDVGWTGDPVVRGCRTVNVQVLHRRPFTISMRDSSWVHFAFEFKELSGLAAAVRTGWSSVRPGGSMVVLVALSGKMRGFDPAPRLVDVVQRHAPTASLRYLCVHEDGRCKGRAFAKPEEERAIEGVWDKPLRTLAC